MAKDPELRYTENGTAVTRFTLAVTRENDRNKADFIYCLSFGKLAESVAQYCKTGRQALVSGRLEINTRKNQQTNENESFTNVIANKVEFLAKPKAEQNQQQESNPRKEHNQQQRFQPTTNGWVNPSDTDFPF